MPPAPCAAAPTSKPGPTASAAGPGSACAPGTGAGRRPVPAPWRNADSGSLAIAFRTIVSRSAGTAGLKRRSGRGSSTAIWRSSSWRSRPSKAGRSVSSS